MFEFTPKPNILQHFVNRKFERGSYTYLRKKRLSFFFFFFFLTSQAGLKSVISGTSLCKPPQAAMLVSDKSR